MLSCSRNKGFTVIEIIISITILTIIFTIFVANVKFLNRFILRSEVDKLFSVFNYLKQCACSTGKEQIFKFDVQNGRYEYGGRIYTLPKKYAEFGFCASVKGPPSSPSSIILNAVTFENNTIVFYPDTVVSSGTVYITDCEKNFMYAISSGVGQAGYIRKYIYSCGNSQENTGFGKWVLIE